jgi:hypothetical protein
MLIYTLQNDTESNDIILALDQNDNNHQNDIQ